MPSAVNAALATMLGRPVPCPNGCRNMMLKTVAAHVRGYCALCAMTTHKHLSGFKLVRGYDRRTFRSEAETFDEGIYDDD